MATPPVIRSPLRNQHLPHYVYEFYDPKGHPVYVGFTRNMADRLRTHQGSAMWTEVDEIHSVRYRNRDEAMAAEARLIRELQPRWNFQYTERASEAARERHRVRRERLSGATS